MKKAFVLSSFILCASGLYAAETPKDITLADGKTRNEQLYERTLEQTGWTDQKGTHQDNSKDVPANTSHSSRKSSASEPHA